MQDNIFHQFRQAGEDLASHGLISTHGGNMSIRHRGRLIITAHFSRLGRLEPGDLVEVPLREEPDHVTSDASQDVALHQLIYKFTPAGAVIHAHPAYAVALSLRLDVITPRDLEGSVLLKEIPVVPAAALTSEIPQLLQSRLAVMARGHGSYVAGKTLDEALACTSALALSCKITWLAGRS